MLSIGASASDAGFASGNLLVVTFPSATTDRISEYTLEGTLVQNIAVTHGGDDLLRDIEVSDDQRIQGYAGTFEPVLMTLDLAAGTSEDHTLAGWSTANVEPYGGIATLREFTFATDMSTASPGEADGIVRFDTTDFSATRFAEGDDYIDVAMGHDGLLYGLDQDFYVHAFDPYALTEVKSMRLDVTHLYRAIAVDADGDLFCAAWNGSAYHYDPSGDVINSLETGVTNLSDLDLRSDGAIAMTAWLGPVKVTDTSLTSITHSFSVPDEGFNTPFVAFSDPLEFTTSDLNVTIVAQEMEENGGSSVITVTRNTEPTSDLVVTLSAEPSGQLSLPATVTIPAGQVSTAFTLSAVNDSVIDDDATVTISASVAGHSVGEDTIIVLDDDGVDYGDAPDTGVGTSRGNYNTLASDSGASHRTTGPRLGTNRDHENDGQPTAGADGDDGSGTVDDEDGVTLPLLTASGAGSTTASVEVDLQKAAATANYLDAWIDFNQDGDWNDAGEQVFTSYNLGTASGVQTLTITVPQDTGSNIVYGSTYARFRLSSTGGLAPTGAASNGEVEDYVVTVAPWFGAPAALNSTAVSDNQWDRYPDIATDTFGNRVAVWTSNNSLDGTIGTDCDVFVSCSTGVNGTWTEAVPLNTDAASDSGHDYRPQVTTDGQGNWVVVWQSEDSHGETIGSDLDILVSRSSDNGATWTAPVPLNSNAATDTGGDVEPEVSTDGSGNWLAVWMSNENLDGAIGTDYDILAARSTDGGATWTAPAPLNGAASDYQSDLSPQVIADGNGNWVAVWESYDNLGATIGSDGDILVSRSSDAGASWSVQAPLNNNAASDVYTDLDPQLATDGAGNWVAVWGSYEHLGATIGTDEDILVASSFDGGVTWTDPSPLNSNAASDSEDDWYPQITTDGNGNWITVWESLDTLDGTIGSDRDILASRSADAGMTWTEVQPLNTNGATDSAQDYSPQIATDEAGNWVAVWRSENSLGGTIGTDADILFATLSEVLWDWGDAPDTDSGTGAGNYNTLATDNGPCHALVPELRMGTAIDADDGSLQNGAADADDLDRLASDDEDGLIDPAAELLISTGAQPPVNVLVTNTTGSVATLFGWIDYNGDGVFDNATERASTAVADGTVGGTVTLTFPEVPAGSASTTYARFRLSTDSAAQDPTGSAADGEVEDYQVSVLGFDFGDAPSSSQSGLPNSYPTLLADDGARHTETGPTLGASRDTEGDGQPSTLADGDDTNGTADEDGIVGASAFAPGMADAWVEVLVSADSYVNAWIDFNADGTWDASEQLATDLALTAGTNHVTFPIPATAVPGITYARLRLTSYDTGGTLLPTGLADDGEVEDYIVQVDDELYLYGTEGDDTVVVRTDGSDYTVTINGIADVYSMAIYSSIVLDGAGGTDSLEIYDWTGDDTFAVDPTQATMDWGSDGVDFTGLGFETVRGIAANGGTDEATLTGTTGADKFYGKETQAYVYDLAGTDYRYTASGFGTVAGLSGGGNDTAYLYGSTGDDAFDVTVGAATMTRSGSTTSAASGFAYINGYAIAGGTDTATMTATTGTDLFTGKETYAYMRNVGGSDYLLYVTGFGEVTADGDVDDTAYLYGGATDDILDMGMGGWWATMIRSGSTKTAANGFGTVTGYAGAGGTDAAWMTGTTGSDLFSGKESGAYMRNVGGTPYFLYAGNFGEVTADGNGGDDLAYLYGSASDDTLELGVGSAMMTRSGAATTVANDFATAYGYAGSGGTDTATLTGTTGADAFYGRESLAYMRNVGGGGYFLYVRDFSEVTANGNSGDDVAYLWGSTSDDTFDVTVGSASMIRSQTTTTAANDFATLYGFATSGGTDTASLTGSTGNDVFYSRESYSILRDAASSAYQFYVGDFSTVEAHGNGGAGDIAYLYGSTSDDTLELTVGSSSMTRAGSTTAVATDFANVNGYAVAGGTDTAILTGTTGSDKFTGKETYAYMENDGGVDYTLYADKFSEVTAYGGGGDDTAYLYGSTSDDTLDMSVGLATMTRAGSTWTEVSDFATVKGYAVEGGIDMVTLIGTTGADTFTGQDDWGIFHDSARADYYFLVRYFDEVYAEAGDTVTGNDTLNVPETGGAWDVDYLFDPGNPLDW